MRTYVNTSLIDAHNAQMQLEQISGDTNFLILAIS